MLNIQEHKFILVQILKDVYSGKELARVLGFKGGTAAYLFYDLPRFSVDLDFTLLDDKKRDLVFENLKNIIAKYGKIKQAREKRFTLFLLLSYGEKAINIKIEVSKRKFVESFELKNYLGLPVLVMRQEDMFANKLAALLGRKKMAYRDLFDLWYFFKNNWPINTALLEKRTDQGLKPYLKKCFKAVEGVNERYILQGLGEVLEPKQKLWTKEHLKKDLLFLMKYYLENN